MQRALSGLAQIYLCLPRGVFDGMAQEAISETAASISRARDLLRAQGDPIEVNVVPPRHSQSGAAPAA